MRDDNDIFRILRRLASDLKEAEEKRSDF